MPYTNPTHSKTDHRGHKKRLTMYNTDNKFNYNSITEADLAHHIVLTDSNIESAYYKVKSTMDHGVLTDKNTYFYTSISHPTKFNPAEFADTSSKENVVADFIKTGVKFKYYADYAPSEAIQEAVGQNPNSCIIYHFTAFTYTANMPKKELIKKAKERRDYINNVEKSGEAGTVIFDCPIILPIMSPYFVNSTMAPLKGYVDEIQFSFPPLHDYEIRSNLVNPRANYILLSDGLWHIYTNKEVEFFKEVRREMSDLKINITFVCQNTADKRQLDKMIMETKNGKKAKKK